MDIYFLYSNAIFFQTNVLIYSKEYINTRKREGTEEKCGHLGYWKKDSPRYFVNW